METGKYLFQRLREVGVDCTFGIPGDFALPIYAAQAKAGMRTVVCTHEPGAAFAADAYARLRGLGVVVVTYGAGALNIVNVVAMSYAEHTPLLVISAAPETTRRGPDLYLHHMVKSFESQLRIYKEITIEAVALDAEHSGAEIDRVIDAVRNRRRPGYIEIPRDLVNAPVPRVDARPKSMPAESFNTEALAEAVEEIARHLDSAQRPALYVGVGVRRYGLTDAALRLAERWSLPVVSSVMGKASFPETHRQFMGVYMGALGDQAARKVLEDSDCVLSLGVINSDVNTGLGTGKLDPRYQIEVSEESTSVHHHRYNNVPITRMVRALAERSASRQRAQPQHIGASPLPQNTPGSRLRTADVIGLLRGLDPAKYSFVADVGDAWFIGLELRVDIFLAPGFYATMGFAVPGALGAGIADPSRRPFVLVGDGAFQMTGPEMATMATQGLRPIVLLLNNSCYGMLEAIDVSRPYYQLRDWDYVAVARAWGCDGERVNTRAALQEALARAEQARGPYLIEAILEKQDVSPTMRRMSEHMAKGRK